jgi:hypothetical protein
MTAEIHDNVFDAALAYIRDNADHVKVLTAGDSVEIIDSTSAPLDSNNFGSIENGDSADGRQMSCLEDDSGDLTQIDVDNAGDATTVVIVDSSGNILVRADITDAPITLGGADKVNFGSFNVILRDPA